MTKSFMYNPPTNTKGKFKSKNHSEFGDYDDSLLDKNFNSSITPT